MDVLRDVGKVLSTGGEQFPLLPHCFRASHQWPSLTIFQAFEADVGVLASAAIFVFDETDKGKVKQL